MPSLNPKNEVFIEGCFQKKQRKTVRDAGKDAQLGNCTPVKTTISQRTPWMSCLHILNFVILPLEFHSTSFFHNSYRTIHSLEKLESVFVQIKYILCPGNSY